MENTNREIAIKMQGVKKKYRLGQIGGGTLQADLQSWWARVRGKDDPNSKIGQEQRLVGQSFMALNGIDLTIYKGEAVGIIGTNGAGKSTLLKLLSRVTAPTEGEIDIYGRIASMLEVGTGFSPEMTGRENVYMNGAILGMTKAEIDAKMEDIIEFSEVRDFIDTPVKRYSSGMYVKLAFSVAAHLDSEIMIMDEVLAVGDMAFQKKCLTKMKEAATQQGRTVLYVSHNMNTIRQLCERCIVLDKGKVIFVGNVEEAIGVYMGGAEPISLHNDCSRRPREGIGDGKIHTLSTEIVGISSPIIYDFMPLDIKVKFLSEQAFSNLAVRLILFSSNHFPVGMCISQSKISANKGENVICLRLYCPNLAPGQYFVRLVFFEENELSTEIVHDVVNDALSFSKDFKESCNKKVGAWNAEVWGTSVYPEIEILEE